MRKRHVQTHALDHGGTALPAVNIKVRHCRWTTDHIAEHFQCTHAVAQRAVDFWFQSAVRAFWEEAREIASRTFPQVTLHAAGRSQGWCVLEGLPDLGTWDAILLGRFAKFARLIRAQIEGLTVQEHAINQIAANRWAEEGAEEYNFVELTPGNTECLTDLKQRAQAPGRGALRD